MPVHSDDLGPLDGKDIVGGFSDALRQAKELNAELDKAKKSGHDVADLERKLRAVQTEKDRLAREVTDQTRRMNMPGSGYSPAVINTWNRAAGSLLSKERTSQAQETIAAILGNQPLPQNESTRQLEEAARIAKQKRKEEGQEAQRPTQIDDLRSVYGHFAGAATGSLRNRVIGQFIAAKAFASQAPRAVKGWADIEEGLHNWTHGYWKNKGAGPRSAAIESYQNNLAKGLDARGAASGGFAMGAAEKALVRIGLNKSTWGVQWAQGMADSEGIKGIIGSFAQYGLGNAATILGAAVAYGGYKLGDLPNQYYSAGEHKEQERLNAENRIMSLMMKNPHQRTTLLQAANIRAGQASRNDSDWSMPWNWGTMNSIRDVRAANVEGSAERRRRIGLRELDMETARRHVMTTEFNLFENGGLNGNAWDKDASSASNVYNLAARAWQSTTGNLWGIKERRIQQRTLEYKEQREQQMEKEVNDWKSHYAEENTASAQLHRYNGYANMQRLRAVEQQVFDGSLQWVEA